MKYLLLFVAIVAITCAEDKILPKDFLDLIKKQIPKIKPICTWKGCTPIFKAISDLKEEDVNLQFAPAVLIPFIPLIPTVVDIGVTIYKHVTGKK